MAFAETADYKCHTPSKKLLYFVFFHAMLDLLSKVYLNPYEVTHFICERFSSAVYYANSFVIFSVLMLQGA